MIARLLISSEPKLIVEETTRILEDQKLSKTHLDVLYFEAGEKLGIAEARKIKDHFSVKPYSSKSKAVVLEDASLLTLDGQNALLKTLEEPPEGAILLLGAASEDSFLPTILSRCQVIKLKVVSDDTLVYHTKYAQDIDHLLKSTIDERFQYIEKLKEKGEFLQALVAFFHQKLHSHMSSGNTDYKDFIKELLRAEKWAKQNVNIRAILEYLMLVMPNKNMVQ